MTSRRRASDTSSSTRYCAAADIGVPAIRVMNAPRMKGARSSGVSAEVAAQ
jgi:hypothetical protein